MVSRALSSFVLMLTSALAGVAAEPDRRFPLFTYLTNSPKSAMVAYVPSQLDPRQDVNNRRLASSSIRADLTALRSVFDGLILYGYHEATTPRILAIAKELKYHAVLLGIWDPKSAAELDGVAALAKLFENDFVLGVIVGNEGVTFKRYEAEDLNIAAARLRTILPKSVPLTMSEPLFQYQKPYAREFGDFLAPNIHPVFDRNELSPAAAATWTRDEAKKLAKLAKKPVLVKETGMPHAGTREHKKYTAELQASFWSEYTKPGKLVILDRDIWVSHSAAFESFDLPWKAAESRMEIEASWGLLNTKRQPYPAFGVWKNLAQ